MPFFAFWNLYFLSSSLFAEDLCCSFTCEGMGFTGDPVSILCPRSATWYRMILDYSSCSLNVVLIDLWLFNVCNSDNVSYRLNLSVISLTYSLEGHLVVTLPFHCSPGLVQLEGQES